MFVLVDNSQAERSDAERLDLRGVAHVNVDPGRALRVVAPDLCEPVVDGSGAGGVFHPPLPEAIYLDDGPVG